MPKDGNNAVKTYIDLHLIPKIKDPDEAGRLIKKAAELGYRMASITLRKGSDEKEAKRVVEICREVGIDPIMRLDLTPKNTRELLNDLRRFRRRYEIIAVISLKKSVARQAAKDRRVDLLSFLPIPKLRFFDKAEAELASRALASLEIEITPLLELNGMRRARLISCLRRETMIAKKFKIPIIISSGATSPHLLRKPRDYAAIASIFDLDQNTAIKAVSDAPKLIIERNRRKLSPNYVAPGVYIVRRGRDC